MSATCDGRRRRDPLFLATVNESRPIIVGNWKMELGLAASRQLAETLGERLAPFVRQAEIAIFPSTPALEDCGRALDGSGVKLGSQDVSWEESGPHTGEVSAAMLRELGCMYVIVGHSERRARGESDETIQKKFSVALAHGLVPILCVGETREQREAGETANVVKRQLESALSEVERGPRFLVAYEPVWAIGSETPDTADDARRVADSIDAVLKRVKLDAVILYGGSVEPGNVRSFVDGQRIRGVLVGRASLDAEEFTAIVQRVCSPN